MQAQQLQLSDSRFQSSNLSFDQESLLCLLKCESRSLKRSLLKRLLLLLIWLSLLLEGLLLMLLFHKFGSALGLLIMR